MTNSALVSKVRRALRNYYRGYDYDYDESKMLLATSLCCDEVNRPLEHELTKAYGDNFNLGGLAGFPSAGITGVKAMSAHIPDDDGGSCLIVYAPHVGIDSNLQFGKLNRRGMRPTTGSSSCCGSAVAAVNHLIEENENKGRRKNKNKHNKKKSKKKDQKKQQQRMQLQRLDAQQSYVNTMLSPYSERLMLSLDDDTTKNKMNVELPHCMYEAQTKVMEEIITAAISSGKRPNIALLGGIQINTQKGQPDYFLPLRFDMVLDVGSSSSTKGGSMLLTEAISLS